MNQKMYEPYVQNKLFCPGPTPIPLGSQLASLNSSIYHRSEEFYREFLECSKKLGCLMDSEESPIILTCSGTGALESAVVNFTQEGDSVIVLNAGKFGERWEKLCNQYACKPHVLKAKLGESPQNDSIQEFLDSIQGVYPKVFFMQANETSTGVYHDVNRIIPLIKNKFPQIKIVVDAISGFGAHPISMRKNQIDVLISASQKGFGLPPGLAFVAVSPSMWEFYSDRSKFYFDLKKEYEGQKKGRAAWTTAISLIQSLHWTLSYIESKGGISTMVENHRRLALATRSAVFKMGLSLFVKNETDRSQALTSITFPNGVEAKKIQNHLKENYGMIFAGGQDELSGKILRLSHLGLIDRYYMIQGISALEWSLKDLNYLQAPFGSGVQGFMESI